MQCRSAPADKCYACPQQQRLKVRGQNKTRMTFLPTTISPLHKISMKSETINRYSQHRMERQVEEE